MLEWCDTFTCFSWAGSEKHGFLARGTRRSFFMSGRRLPSCLLHEQTCFPTPRALTGFSFYKFGFSKPKIQLGDNYQYPVTITASSNWVLNQPPKHWTHYGSITSAVFTIYQCLCWKCKLTTPTFTLLCIDLENKKQGSLEKSNTYIYIYIDIS